MKGGKDTVFYPKRLINCRGKILDLSTPVVMGILNATPDSFHSDSRISTVDDAVARAENMVAEGASIIDVGGQSTRPGAERVSADEEKRRVIPVVKALRKAFPDVIISIDTFFSSVAEQALVEGADIVNDVSAGQIDNQILEVLARHEAPYVLMHMRGTPENMQDSPEYGNVVAELMQYFGARIQEALDAGIKDIILDPGFGFGKTIDQNYEILKRLGEFQSLGYPVLTGLSRKGMVRKPLGLLSEEALNTTTAANTIALINGASILRVHDVKEAVETIRIVGLTNP